MTESNALMADRASEGAPNVVPLTVVNDEAATFRSKVKQYEKSIEGFEATCDARAVKRFWKARDVSTSQQIQMMDQMIKHRGNLRMSVDAIVDLALKEGNEHWRSIHFSRLVAPKIDRDEGAVYDLSEGAV